MDDEWLHEPPPGKPFGTELGQIAPGWESMFRVGYAIDPYADGFENLWVWPPGCFSAFPLDSRWTWERHDDGTVTVNPSVAVGEGGSTYHGWLKRGRWVPA